MLPIVLYSDLFLMQKCEKKNTIKINKTTILRLFKITQSV